VGPHDHATGSGASATATRASGGHLHILDVQDNLPAALTSFVGRQSEIGTVAAQLDRTRLLTLTGSGGIGKTRLAIEVAQAVRDRYPGGVWLVELGALADPELVTQSIAAVFGVRQAGPRPIMELLLDALSSDPVLLLLDNCEHLLDACAASCEALLRARPRLGVLATSREPLRIPGEVVWRVPPLTLPDRPSATDGEAIRLFVDRARAVQPSFSLSSANSPATSEICRNLDGIPLAIELAAAWVKTLSVQEIAARLDDRFHLLTGGGRTALPRQQTLKGTLDWSYGLLSDGERLLLRRLSVFEGGWTVEAAESVCAGDGLLQQRVLGALAGLVDKSLIIADSESTPARYRILETTRQYGLELLSASDEIIAVRARHAAYFRALAQRTRREVLGPRQVESMQRMDQEQDNIRAALRWAAEQSAPRDELAIVAALWDYWWIRGQLSEGLRHVEGALERSAAVSAVGHASEDRCRATHGAGLLAAVQGDMHAGQRRMQEAVMLYRAADDRAGSIRPLCDLASTCTFLGNAELGEKAAIEALRIARGETDEWALAYAVHTLGQLRLAQGRHAESARFCEDEVEIFRSLGDARGLAHALLQWSIAVRRMGDAARALGLARQTLEPFRGLGETWGELGAIVVIAACAVDLPEAETAARLLGAARALARITGAVPIPTWQQELDFAQRGARALLDEAAFVAAFELGERDSTAEALEYARSFASTRAAEVTASSSGDLPGGLTRRECEVLQFLAQRYSNREIADALVLSVRTVERHITNIYNKTGLTTRREAEAFARNHHTA
jgi:predicted ATPase/DNA-binding CsgD family transcriptional regulator